MLKRNLWKIGLSLLILGWAIFALMPIRNIEFADYVKAHATARNDEFNALMAKATQRWKAGSAPSEFVALKQIGREQKIDLSEFFPNVRLEESLKNIGKRNDILLKYLLDSSRARLQMGLDLRGGVGFTLEADLGTKTAGYDEESARREKLTKAIDIISARINSIGVAEPLIRAVGTNRIEVQLPGVNTKDNPDVLDEVKKPARLDFRVVYPYATPETARPGEIPPGYEVKSYDHERPDGTDTAEEYFVKRIPEMTGEAIAYSTVQHDTYGKPLIAMRFTSEGRKQFARITREIAATGDRANGRLGQLAIVLDGTLCSVPTVK